MSLIHANRRTWYSAMFLSPMRRKGLKASMYLAKPSPSTSTRVPTAMRASSCTPPVLLFTDDWNICRSAAMIVSDICGACSDSTLRRTL